MQVVTEIKMNRLTVRKQKQKTFKRIGEQSHENNKQCSENT